MHFMLFWWLVNGFIGDQLRELLVNEDSERSCLLDNSKRRELIFQLFKILAVGGAMCQPETKIDRYLDMTKQFYKDLLTIYK